MQLEEVVEMQRLFNLLWLTDTTFRSLRPMPLRLHIQQHLKRQAEDTKSQYALANIPTGMGDLTEDPSVPFA